MYNNTPPCKTCTNRSSVCHIEGNCKEYDRWKSYMSTRRQEEKKVTDVQGMYNAFRINCRDAALRKSSSHGYYS